MLVLGSLTQWMLVLTQCVCACVLVYHGATVFLDLPNPWLAVAHAKEAMKVMSLLICCFGDVVLNPGDWWQTVFILTMH